MPENFNAFKLLTCISIKYYAHKWQIRWKIKSSADGNIGFMCVYADGNLIVMKQNPMFSLTDAGFRGNNSFIPCFISY